MKKETGLVEAIEKTVGPRGGVPNCVEVRHNYSVPCEEASKVTCFSSMSNKCSTTYHRVAGAREPRPPVASLGRMFHNADGAVQTPDGRLVLGGDKGEGRSVLGGDREERSVLGGDKGEGRSVLGGDTTEGTSITGALRTVEVSGDRMVPAVKTADGRIVVEGESAADERETSLVPAREEPGYTHNTNGMPDGQFGEMPGERRADGMDTSAMEPKVPEERVMDAMDTPDTPEDSDGPAPPSTGLDDGSSSPPFRGFEPTPMDYETSFLASPFPEADFKTNLWPSSTRPLVNMNNLVTSNSTNTTPGKRDADATPDPDADAETDANATSDDRNTTPSPDAADSQEDAWTDANAMDGVNTTTAHQTDGNEASDHHDTNATVSQQNAWTNARLDASTTADQHSARTNANTTSIWRNANIDADADQHSARTNANAASNYRNQNAMTNATCNNANAMPRNVNLLNLDYSTKLQAYNDWVNCIKRDPRSGNLPIHAAVLDNDNRALERQCFLLTARKMSMDVKNFSRKTPLHLAVSSGRTMAATILRKFGARLDETDARGNNSIHLAVETETTASLRALLVPVMNRRETAPVNKYNDNGYTPLHVCCIHDKPKHAQLLLEHKAEHDLKDLHSGRTPLFLTVELDLPEVMSILLAAGAQPLTPNFAGQTALALIGDSPYRNPEVRKMFEKSVYEAMNEEAKRLRAISCSNDTPMSQTGNVRIMARVPGRSRTSGTVSRPPVPLYDAHADESSVPVRNRASSTVSKPPIPLYDVDSDPVGETSRTMSWSSVPVRNKTSSTVSKPPVTLFDADTDPVSDLTSRTMSWSPILVSDTNTNKSPVPASENTSTGFITVSRPPPVSVFNASRNKSPVPVGNKTPRTVSRPPVPLYNTNTNNSLGPVSGENTPSGFIRVSRSPVPVYDTRTNKSPVPVSENTSSTGFITVSRPPVPVAASSGPPPTAETDLVDPSQPGYKVINVTYLRKSGSSKTCAPPTGMAFLRREDPKPAVVPFVPKAGAPSRRSRRDMAQLPDSKFIMVTKEGTVPKTYVLKRKSL